MAEPTIANNETPHDFEIAVTNETSPQIEGATVNSIDISFTKEADSADATETPPGRADNYHSQPHGRWLASAAVFLMACLAIAGWLEISSRQGQSGTISPSSPTLPAGRSSVPATSAQASEHIQPTPVMPAATSSVRKLPSFIPKNGRDLAYSLQKPDWECYIDSYHEFRILRSGERIKTVQILASAQHDISGTLLKSALSEISGNSSYKEISHREDQGFLITRGRTASGAHILIYSQKSRIRAFVISVG